MKKGGRDVCSVYDLCMFLQKARKYYSVRVTGIRAEIRTWLRSVRARQPPYSVLWLVRYIIWGNGCGTFWFTVFVSCGMFTAEQPTDSIPSPPPLPGEPKSRMV